MLRWSVERVELQVAVTGVHDVVPHPGGDDDRPVVLDVVLLVDSVLAAAELHPPRPRLDPEELVEVRVRLSADVLARRQPHDRELRVLAGVDHRAERLVLERRALDVTDPSEHRSSLRVIGSARSLPVPTTVSAA